MASFDISTITLCNENMQINESDFVHYMESLQTLDISTCNPPSWLQHTETPFKWAQSLNPKKMMRCDSDRKLEDYPEEDQDGCYSYEKFSYYLVNVFQSTLIRDDEKAKQSLQKLQNFVRGISKNGFDDVYNRIGQALEHILLAVTAQVSLLNGDITEEKSRNIGLSLETFTEMKPEVQAGVEALKSHFYLLCYIDDVPRIKHIKEATKLDPEYAAWLYWTGKNIRKTRKYKKDEPAEEIYYFELAVDKKKDPKYILFLAQGYREKAHYLFSKSKTNRKDITEEENLLPECSVKLYRECWNLNKDSAAINRRLGNGFMSLKEPYADYTLAKQLLEKAVEQSKNPITFHILGSFYEKYEQDFEKAKEMYVKGAEAGVLFCFDELVRLNYVFDPKYDPYEDLKKLEVAKKYSVGLPETYKDLGWYYLSFKQDLCKAVEYFLKAADKAGDEYLTRFYCTIFFVNSTINMYPLLKNEIERYRAKYDLINSMKAEQNVNTNIQEEENVDNESFKKLLDKIAENPDLITCEGKKVYSLSKIKAISTGKLKYFREKLTKHGYNFNTNLGLDRQLNNQLQVKAHGSANESTNVSSGNPISKESNWRMSQKSPVKDKSYNWRTECKDY